MIIQHAGCNKVFDFNALSLNLSLIYRNFCVFQTSGIASSRSSASKTASTWVRSGQGFDPLAVVWPSVPRSSSRPRRSSRCKWTANPGSKSHARSVKTLTILISYRSPRQRHESNAMLDTPVPFQASNLKNIVARLVRRYIASGQCCHAP